MHVFVHVSGDDLVFLSFDIEVRKGRMKGEKRAS